MPYKVLQMTGLHLIYVTEDSLSLCLIQILINKLLHVKYQWGQCLAHMTLSFVHK